MPKSRRAELAAAAFIRAAEALHYPVRARNAIVFAVIGLVHLSHDELAVEAAIRLVSKHA